MIENLDRWTDGRPLESHPISSPSAFGSGELKIQLKIQLKYNKMRGLAIQALKNKQINIKLFPYIVISAQFTDN